MKKKNIQGQATHHQITANEAGVLTVNNTVYGNDAPTDLPALLNTLNGKPKGWCVVFISITQHTILSLCVAC